MIDHEGKNMATSAPKVTQQIFSLNQKSISPAIVRTAAQNKKLLHD
jgi:hypothetical protein